MQRFIYYIKNKYVFNSLMESENNIKNKLTNMERDRNWTIFNFHIEKYDY